MYGYVYCQGQVFGVTFKAEAGNDVIDELANQVFGVTFKAETGNDVIDELASQVFGVTLSWNRE